MESDFEFETKVRSRRKWATSARYHQADNDPTETRKAPRGQLWVENEHTTLALGGFKYTPWGSPSQFLEASREQDNELMAEIMRFLEQMTELAPSQIQVSVECGWVTLTGQLEWNHQRARIISAVRHMRGVDGLIDTLTTKPRHCLTLCR
ncbi:putative RNA-binding protein Jag [Silvimonas terrae]|uniref:Putative RNA-binding protein Jag n=1 Tax=Silvimonas terrae TaxID=300266 RepID=A0A840REI8_9NEIS|nr:BON domain-containing protein [Silvimonas terrae]MBB5191745.1 putative RNA-binding protein Jag [Silvimonas terrae]